MFRSASNLRSALRPEWVLLRVRSAKRRNAGRRCPCHTGEAAENRKHASNERQPCGWANDNCRPLVIHPSAYAVSATIARPFDRPSIGCPPVSAVKCADESAAVERHHLVQDEIGRVLMNGHPWCGIAVSNVDEPVMAAVCRLDRRHQLFHVHREIAALKLV